MKTVLFIDTVHPVLWDRLEIAGFNCVDATQSTQGELKKEIENAFGVVIRSRIPMDVEVLDAAKHLEFIARSGAGMENIDVDYCHKRGIRLFNAPEGNRNAVAEHALGMLLNILNKLNQADQEVRNGIWNREGNRGIELDGKNVGIIGFGNNGEAFAKKLAGFDVQIYAYDKYKKNFGDQRVIECSLEELMEKSDVISFHIPQNEETIYFADQDFFDNVSKPFYLLNLSRGKIVSIEALVEAMKGNKVLGAGLDVLEYENATFESFHQQELPEAFEYLIQAKNVILTPHVGGWTNESHYKLSEVLADKILAFYS